MIYRIEIENFFSFKDRQVLDIRVPANVSTGHGRLIQYWQGSEKRIPKVIAIFGANGSGKSNLLRVLSFVYWFIGYSFSLSANERMPLEAFNDQAMLKEPTRIKIWQSWRKDIGLTEETVDFCPYLYELTLDSKSQKVISEGIFYWPTSTRRKTRLIERLGDGRIKSAKKFDLAGYKVALEKILRPNASMISTLAQLNHPIANAMVTEIEQNVQTNILIEKFEIPDSMVLNSYAKLPELVKRFNREVRRIDVGVREIEVRRDTNGFQIMFQHEGLYHPMPQAYESHGTRQFLRLFPLLEAALGTGGFAIIDELDSAIHPLILAEIIGWFHDPDRNPHHAQLWMSCQNVSLLEEMSRDEVVFCEKDHLGRSEIYRLNDIGGVRRDDNYYRKYLSGAFGAVPHIG